MYLFLRYFIAVFNYRAYYFSRIYFTKITGIDLGFRNTVGQLKIVTFFIRYFSSKSSEISNIYAWYITNSIFK